MYLCMLMVLITRLVYCFILEDGRGRVRGCPLVLVCTPRQATCRVMKSADHAAGHSTLGGWSRSGAGGWAAGWGWRVDRGMGLEGGHILLLRLIKVTRTWDYRQSCTFPAFIPGKHQLLTCWNLPFYTAKDTYRATQRAKTIFCCY